MKKGLFLIISIFFIYAPQNIFAERVNGLYQGRVAVDSQSVTDRMNAASLLLTQVLEKVSGNNQIMTNPIIRSKLADAYPLIEEYSYMPNENPDINKPYILRARFDAESVHQWLREAKLPIWEENRPLLLTWIYKEGYHETPQIFSQDTEHPPLHFLKEKAEQRGLPIALPFMDDKDKLFISPNKFQNFSKEDFLTASLRYGSSIVLVGRLTQDAAGFISHWRLYAGQEKWEWHFYSVLENEIFSKVLDNVANILAKRYAIVTTNTIQKNIALRIIGIKEQNEFAKLIRYLSQLTPVAHVGISRIIDNEIVLNISLRSSEQVFAKAISFSQQLTPLFDQNQPLTLVYKWNPA